MELVPNSFDVLKVGGRFYQSFDRDQSLALVHQLLLPPAENGLPIRGGCGASDRQSSAEHFPGPVTISDTTAEVSHESVLKLVTWAGRFSRIFPLAQQSEYLEATPLWFRR
jgi:hypothetical protein